jgi:hypothetical protein
MLVRYEDWTFREAEVRLNEHGEWRRALGLRQPHAPRRCAGFSAVCRRNPSAARWPKLLGLAFNLYRLKHHYSYPRMTTEPDSF